MKLGELVMVKNESIDKQSNTWGERYRVKKLAQYLGNEETVGAIHSFIRKKQPPQAILLTGPTGVGKTTLAQIIAKDLNEVDRFNKSLAKSVNCGSDGGIDHIRSLIESTRFVPQLNYNIIILDEVHLLSRNSVSALLVELEKVSNAIWIMTTNEPETMLPTFLRRCVQFRLDYPQTRECLKLLARVCKQENVFQPVKKYKEMLRAVVEFSHHDPRLMLNGLQNVALRFAKQKEVPDADTVDRIIQGTTKIDKGVDPIADLIMLGQPGKLSSLVGVYYWKMDMRFCSDLLRKLVNWQHKRARGDSIRLSNGEEVRMGYNTIAQVVDRIVKAADLASRSPSIISAPATYSAILNCAHFVKEINKGE